MNMKLYTTVMCSLLANTANAFSRSACRPVSAVVCRSYLDGLSPSEMSGNRGYSAKSYSKSSASWLDTSQRVATMSTAAATPVSKLTLEIADVLANGVVEVAKRNNFAPIVVTVVDYQANAIVQKRMDNVVHAAFPEFSYAKAYTCVTMGVSSREFRDKYTTENAAAKIGQMNSMMAISGKMAAFPGGVLLSNGSGEIVGAIGVSGAAGDEDEYVALKAVWESGLELQTKPLEHSCATARD